MKTWPATARSFALGLKTSPERQEDFQVGVAFRKGAAGVGQPFVSNLEFRVLRFEFGILDLEFGT